MTVYLRQDAYGNRQAVDEDTYLLDTLRHGCTIVVNSGSVCVYRPKVSPSQVKAEPKLKYGGRGRGWKSPVGYGGY